MCDAAILCNEKGKMRPLINVGAVVLDNYIRIDATAIFVRSSKGSCGRPLVNVGIVSLPRALPLPPLL